MKFAVTLIKLFSGLLSAVIFGAFIYYLQQYIQTKNNANLFISNIAFLLFIISSITFALVFMVYDAYNNKNLGETLVKDIINKIKEVNNVTEADNSATVVSSLQKLSLSNNENNSILIENFKSLTEQLQTLNNSVVSSGEQQKNASESLTSLQEQISTNIANIHKRQNNEITNTLEQKIDILVQTITNLSTDINNLNGRTLDIIHEINKNISEIANNQNTIKSISDRISILHPEQNIYSENLKNEFTDSTNELEKRISIADFYEQQINDYTPKETSNFENNFTEQTITPEPTVNVDENIEIFVDKIVSPEETSNFENNFTEQTITPKPIVNVDKIGNFNNNTFQKSIDVSQEITKEMPIYDPEKTLIKTNNPELLASDNPFGTSISEEIPMYDPNIPVEEKIDLSFNDENQFGINDFEIPIYEQTEEIISLEPENPYGNPISDEMPMYESPVTPEEKIDLSMDINEQFGAPVNLDGENYSFSSQPTSSTFNEELANELANLDILKNKTSDNNESIEEISLDDLLNGDKNQ